MRTPPRQSDGQASDNWGLPNGHVSFLEADLSASSESSHSCCSGQQRLEPHEPTSTPDNPLRCPTFSWAMEMECENKCLIFLRHQVLGDLLRTSDNWYTEQLTYTILLSCSWVIEWSRTMYYYSVMPFRCICYVRALFHNNEAKERESFFLPSSTLKFKKKTAVLKISRHFVWNARNTLKVFMLF